MTSDENVRAFKEAARDYPKYLEYIQRIDDKLEVLRTRMEEMHSVNPEKEPVTFSFSEMIERKALLETEKQYYQNLIDWVHQVIDSFGSPAIKALVWMTYVQRRSLSSISDELLISKDNLYKIRRKYLNRALNDDVMAQLDEIRNDHVIENAM